MTFPLDIVIYMLRYNEASKNNFKNTFNFLKYTKNAFVYRYVKNCKQ